MANPTTKKETKINVSMPSSIRDGQKGYMTRNFSETRVVDVVRELQQLRNKNSKVTGEISLVTRMDLVSFKTKTIFELVLKFESCGNYALVTLSCYDRGLLDQIKNQIRK